MNNYTKGNKMTTRLMMHCMAVIATCCVVSANPEAIQERLKSRPVYKKAQAKTDWLIDDSGYKADVYRSNEARIREQEGKSRNYAISRDYSVEVPVKLKAEGMTWFVIE